jgi:hypothetical protein
MWESSHEPQPHGLQPAESQLHESQPREFSHAPHAQESQQLKCLHPDDLHSQEMLYELQSHEFWHVLQPQSHELHPHEASSATDSPVLLLDI